MNVLVTCIPQSGHERPLVPLVEAFVAGGDRVVVATGPGSCGALANVGAETRTAGDSETTWMARLAERTPGQPGDGIPPGRINHYFLPRLFGEIAAADMVDDVVAIGRATDADLVMFDGSCFAGPLAAAILGVPAVHHMISPQFTGDVVELVNDAVTPLWRRHGLDAPKHAGLYDGTTIQICPPSLEPSWLPGGHGIRMRPAPPPTRPGSRGDGSPLVYVTLGTFMHNNDVFRTIIEGLVGARVRAVVTVGADNDPAALGPVPDHVRIERFVPQADLLPDCAAVVHHGGCGTMFGSLAHGLPQVVVPQGADNFINADLLRSAGIGETVGPDELSAHAVRSAVSTVLDDATYTVNAQAVAAEMSTMADATTTAGQLRSTIRTS